MSLVTCSDIDHFIWIAKDYENGKKTIMEKFETAPVDGGKHLGYGTQNALLGLGENLYLEILSPDLEQAQPNHWSRAIFAANSDGIFHWAAKCSDLKSLHNKALACGYESSGPLAFSRKAPNGEIFSWQLLFLGGHNFGALVPFFIDWGNTPHPSKNIPMGGQLYRFSLASPQANSLRKFMQSLDINVDITQSEIARIDIEVKTKNSTISLPSLNPIGNGVRM